ncbi:hypothetical protein BM1_02334 [Bipolaris maydis]|nr:hypothetical protein BM1_02334 [Bipolaris maydis]
MAAIARNNAFGAGAPSWNLSFPAGNITAAEITAYCPHWLKSIDVVNRFLSHGARTIHIAALLNEFRTFPDNRVFNTNSTLVMMSYAMRKAGFDGWCVMKHFDFSREHFLPESGLSVTHFRTPCMTQPRDETSEEAHHAINQEVCPVAFKDLARHVKKHPSGDDALDLARCVQYAIEHPDEVWLFPTDFQRLTTYLGGPATITPNHLDEQVFARRDGVKIPTTKRKRSAAIKPISKKKQPINQQQTTKQPTRVRRFINVLSKSGPSQPRKRGSDHLSTKDTNSAEECEAGHEENEPFGQAAKKRKLSRCLSTFNLYVNDDQFLPDETGASEGISVRDFDPPEQDELPTSEADRSIALRKAREGKRAAVEPGTAAPQPDVEPNPDSLQPDFLDCDQVLNFFPTSDHQANLSSNHGQQLDGVSSHAQNSNVASGHGQKSSFPNVRNQQPDLAPSHIQQPSFTPACGQNVGVPSNYHQPSHRSSGYGQQSSFASGYGQESDLTADFGLKPVATHNYGQQHSLPLTYSHQSAIPSGRGQQAVLPSNYGWQSSSTPSFVQKSNISSGYCQPSSFTTGNGQNPDPASNVDQNSNSAPNFDPLLYKFPLSSGSQRPKVTSSHDQPPFSFVPQEYQQPFSLASTIDQIPLDFTPNFDPNALSFATTLDQIPLDFNPTFDQRPSNFDPIPATEQVEPLNFDLPYTQPCQQSYVQPDTITTADPLPALLTPPILPTNRLQITTQNLHKYALPPFRSQDDMYTTAFHYKRFGGARQSAPYRELHNLCCLDDNDTGDWAENIRFATEQWLYYGSIWTEFEGHLEKIRSARLAWVWKSPEAIRADATKSSLAT